MKVIGILLLLIILGIGALFHWSKPFAANVNEVVSQSRDWTYENRVKNPSGFLSYLSDECTRVIEALDARSLGLETNRVRIQNLVRSDRKREQSIARGFEALRQSWIGAKERGEWPVRLVDGELVEASSLQTQLIEVAGKIRSLRNALLEKEQTLEQVSRQLQLVKEYRERARLLRIDVITKLESVRLQEAVNKVDGLAEQVEAHEASFGGIIAQIQKLSPDLNFERLVSELDAESERQSQAIDFSSLIANGLPDPGSAEKAR